MSGPGTAVPQPRGPGGPRAGRTGGTVEAVLPGQGRGGLGYRLPGFRVAPPVPALPGLAMQRFTVNIKLPARTLTGALSAPNRGAADW